VVRAGLGMSWPRTVRAAWHALRAIQLWAPLAGNDPEGARRNKQRYYATKRFTVITRARCLPSILLNRRIDSAEKDTHRRRSTRC
jgi:hypothetical protein